MKTKTPKINFKNRDSRNDKRRKNVFEQSLQGDFALLMSHFDNSMGDYNHLLFDFIERQVPNARQKFQRFLQSWLQNEIYADSTWEHTPKEL